MMNLSFPFRIDGRGKVAEADYERHIRDLIEQVLFTNPGERVNRPDFGSGLSQLQFAPGSDELVNAVQFLVQGALQRWVGDLIQIDTVHIETTHEGELTITVQYRLLATAEQQIVRYQRKV